MLFGWQICVCCGLVLSIPMMVELQVEFTCPTDNKVDASDGGWWSRHWQAGFLLVCLFLLFLFLLFILLAGLCVVKAAPCWRLEHQLSWEWECFDSKLRIRKTQTVSPSEAQLRTTWATRIVKRGHTWSTRREGLALLKAIFFLPFSKQNRPQFIQDDWLNHLSAISQPSLEAYSPWHL